MDFQQAVADQNRLREIEMIEDEIYPDLLSDELRRERDDLERKVSRAVNLISRMDVGERTPQMINFLKN